MARSINVQLGSDAEWLRHALEQCAKCVIDENESGQRDARLSPMIRMIGGAFIGNGTATVWLLRELKRVATEGSSYSHSCFTEQEIRKANKQIVENTE